MLAIGLTLMFALLAGAPVAVGEPTPLPDHRRVSADLAASASSQLASSLSRARCGGRSDQSRSSTDH